MPKTAQITPAYDSQSELAASMSVVWAEYDNAANQLKRCRRVITANAALFNAERRLRERLAEFRGESVKVGDVW